MSRLDFVSISGRKRGNYPDQQKQTRYGNESTNLAGCDRGIALIELAGTAKGGQCREQRRAAESRFQLSSGNLQLVRL